MAFRSPVAMLTFALVMLVGPAVLAAWLAYDARERGVLGQTIVWVVAFFTTSVGALLAVGVYWTQIRSHDERTQRSRSLA